MSGPHPGDPQPVVLITMRDVYETVKTTEAMVAQLANNMRHAEDWRNEADRDIRDLFGRTALFATRVEHEALASKVSACVTRRELYTGARGHPR